MDTPIIELEPYAKYGRPKAQGLSLHIGCGDYWFEGYINIDDKVYAGTDMICDIRQGLPFQPETVKIIEGHDVLEHFNRDEVFNMLEDFKRVLIAGGLVVMSVPDMDGLIAQYEQDKANTIQQIYSIEDHPSHKWGYTIDSLKQLFEEHGFMNCIVERVQWKHRPGEPKLKIIAQKL